MKIPLSKVDAQQTTYNKKVTKATLTAALKPSVQKRLEKYTSELLGALTELSAPFRVEAVAKCSEEDTFDKKKGEIIAARKAEKVASQEAYKRIKKLENILTKLKKETKSMAATLVADQELLTRFINKVIDTEEVK